MTEKALAALEAINAKKAEIEALTDAENFDDAEKEMENLTNLQRKFDLLNVVSVDEKKEEVKDMAEAIKPVETVDAVKAFADAARAGFKNLASEGVPSDGGYTVPQDIQTKINQYKEAEFSLQSLVTTESVSTVSGARTYMTRAEHKGFSAVGEGAKIGATEEPKFERIEYNVKKYAGYLPVTNELLEDSDANITSTLVEWLAKEDIATRNSLIVKAVKDSGSRELIESVDDIKRIINVTIGPAYAGSVAIVTNESGLQFFDTLKDKNGRPLLTPNANANSPMDMVLAVGARSIPLVIVPSSVLPNDEQNDMATFIIGDLKEAVRLFERKGIQIMTSNTAAVGTLNAYEQDLTLFRAVERFDCQIVDQKAFRYGILNIAG